MKLIILDRDGTINSDSDDYVKSPEEWQPLPGALEAIARLTHAGWHVVIASNQSGLGRGLFDVSPGLFEQIGSRFGVPLKGVPTAGDSVRDLQAGSTAGCEPHLVLTGKSERYRQGGQPDGLPVGTRFHTDLSAFVDFILQRPTPTNQTMPN